MFSVFPSFIVVVVDIISVVGSEALFKLGLISLNIMAFSKRILYSHQYSKANVEFISRTKSFI